MLKRSTRIPLAALLVVLPASVAQSQEATDRDFVLTMGELQPFGADLPLDFEAYESISRRTLTDGSVAIEYEFEAPEELGLPYLYSIAETHPSNDAACESFAAGNAGARSGGIEVQERNDIFRYGDDSLFGLLVEDGDPYGNLFSMCRGRTSFMVILGAFYFDDGESWAELIVPTLEAIDSQDWPDRVSDP